MSEAEARVTAIAVGIPLRCAPTLVVDILQPIERLMGRQARAADVSLGFEIGADVPDRVFVDDRKIAWALTVLVGNALRYVRHGSQAMPGGAITVHASRNALGAVVFAVQDDGPGIPRERLQSLLDESPGTPLSNLGLALIRDVVEAHGGHLEVTSATSGAGRGTTVRITLPTAAGLGPPCGEDAISTRAASRAP